MGNYPNERSAKEEIGRYIEYYNTRRPHQALMNFTPNYVHQVNNKTVLLAELKTMKKAARERRKAYWLHPENSLQDGVEGEGSKEIHSHTEGMKSQKK